MPHPETNLIDTFGYLYNVQFSERQRRPGETRRSSSYLKPEERPRVKEKGRTEMWRKAERKMRVGVGARRGAEEKTWRREAEKEVVLVHPPPPTTTDDRRSFARAGEAGCKVEKTVSITPGTHRRIICWGWVNCDLRSVMTCNNFLSLLSVSRQGRSPQRGEGFGDGGEKRKTGSWTQSKQMRGDVTCNVGSGNYSQINYWRIKARVNSAGWIQVLEVDYSRRPK